MFTDNKDFYPTPEAIINKMLCDIDFDYIQSILEPSAGKGNIIEAIKRKEESGWQKRNFDIDCIEADQNLQHILKGKNYRLVHNDFLTYDTMKEYDLIIMNPPFSNGCKHLLKAIEMQKRNGGAIVCLLNAETLKNQYSNDRTTLVKLLTEFNASIEYLQDSFTDAERKTDVEIVLIKVQLPKPQRESFIFDGLKKAEEQKEEYTYTEDTQLAENDLYKSIVSQYELEVMAGINLIKEYNAMSPLIMREFGKDAETGETIQKGGCILSLDLSTNRDKYRNELSINGFIKEVRGKYWTALFNNPKFIGKLTGNLKTDFYNRIEDLKNYEFSLYNIYELKIEMSKKVVKGIEETIIGLFDEFSHKHYWDKDNSSNIHYYNGWKTNKSWIINKKVIIPLSGYDSFWNKYRPTDYKVKEKLQDIEKCFNYLDGGITEAVDLEESLKFAEEYGETKDIQLKYFSITFYKKGTCHITFTNEELLARFNLYGSQKKGWLPNNFGKSKYKDMTQEEKNVVDSFCGKERYDVILNNTDYYLFDANRSILMIEGENIAC
ncbi:DUF4942 domain-containing protein [Lactonifactor sp. BIOML-A3]|nr:MULTISPECIES: DUF4942 domain-containing protein [unclassified Lactonifactor]MSB69387.1 DUF4942 domain-containing protein [Lactonifactor sp. BIOML-A7]MSA02181.1 DUF4942 domain-containing protein [Lactonifactor sp. BIOML-A5]MSA07966.1 DUF4942 domain-containing protein [Lactonifactor sp. BIOML-A4]MSA12582.1 DUF4942 domain-containing protein [Lactonifactor sp. BIOML-A3]MSA16717.1 DUF4942 domain-containing protein [Lactonifactor sp. BIOML-A2]